ncbi:hypothetical protein OG689_44215 [Kitasatospora sp. NBC_00240]|uniref:hypothetical protein n=1 Tax=Kitasatospora sp. NBC_00240 TaxID=2903567 RepID=UPI00225394D3|nr:hypothetical protein [Kitasatospora sp. NBC_00240]MCX5216143.1 hypothetical protein [Kitasatospora sp. NBC_00240]
MSSVHETPASTSPDLAVDLNAYLLEPGYVPASLDGQVVAVPLHPGPATPALIPALVDGRVIAVPVHNPLAALAPQAQPAPAPATPAQPAADPGLPRAVRQCVLYGSAAALAAGGCVWMVGAAVGDVAPHADQLGTVLKWAAIAVATVVVGVAALLGKLRAVVAGTGTGTGASATASGDGASATGTVLALVHRTHQTSIGKQTAWGRGGITNNNG